MKTRIQEQFAKHTFNKAGMMTRGQKKRYETEFGKSARVTQELKNAFVGKTKAENWDNWVSPSRFYDYFQEDEFMYILNKKGKKKEDKEKDTEKVKMTLKRSLFEEGTYFEEKVFEYYNRLFPGEIVQISKGGRDDARNNTLIRKTKKEILKGTPIIYQGVLSNKELKCHGIADLIVRSDYLEKLVTEFEGEDVEVKAPNVKGPYHYRVVDIKCKTLQILKNEALSNALTFRYPKAQLWFYNYELSRIQGYDPKVAYVLGKRVCVSKTKTMTFNYMFGEVDYREHPNDVYEKDVRNCINWIRESRRITLESLYKMDLPLPRPEMYPNMRKRVTEDKLKFAKHIGEITTLYACGKRNRNRAFEQKVFSYKNEKCTPALLGFEESPRFDIVEADLHLTHYDRIIYPEKGNLITDFFGPRNYLAAVDFEFLREFDYEHLPNIDSRCCVYMIGLAIKDVTRNVVRSKVFTVEEISHQGEKEMLKQFVQFLNIPDRLELLHWNHTEPHLWTELMKKHPDVNRMCNKHVVSSYEQLGPGGLLFSDMLKVFKEEPILVKDAHSFSLKPFVKKCVEHGLFTSRHWESLNCMDGAETIVLIKQAREMSLQMDIPINELSLTRDIEEYNLADCMVLIDLFEGIRRHYHSNEN